MQFIWYIIKEATVDEAYKIILEIILGREINFKGEPIAENEKRKELLGKIARLDVCAIGDDNRVYNAEVQKENQIIYIKACVITAH